MRVEDVMVLTAGGFSTIDLTILGEPIAQNGWKLRFRNCSRPFLYDPLRSQKMKLRNSVKAEMVELGEPVPFFKGTRLQVSIISHFHTATRKDLDNLSKFLLDAMEGVLYDDDKWIFHLVVKKVETTSPSMVVSVSSLPNS